MIALPSVGEVVVALAEFGVTRCELPGILQGPRGPTRIVCLERKSNQQTLISQALPDTEHIPWPTFNSICRQLGIDPAEVRLPTPRPPTWWLASEQHLPLN